MPSIDIIKEAPLLEMVHNSWTELLKEVPDEEITRVLLIRSRMARPLSSEQFVAHIERIAGCILLPKKRGRKSKNIKK